MSTTLYPHDRPTETVNPRLRARALRYLKERYSLTEKDLQGQDDFLISLAHSLDRTDQLVTSNTALFRKSVRNALTNLGIESISEEDLAAVAEIVRNNIGASFEGVETFLEGFHPLEAAQEFLETVTPIYRDEAVEEMDHMYSDVFEDWTESECALTDEQMQARFRARVAADQRYLSTYFDTACMGLVDIALQEEIDLKARQDIARRGWPKFVHAMKKRITRKLEAVEPGEERRFNPEHCYLAANGTSAFQMLREACVPRGSRVLASSEEYAEMVDDMKENGVDVVRFSSLEELVHLLDGSSFDYILVSEVSRLGEVHPLKTYNEARKLLSPETKLIVDSCQSAGRWEHDLRNSEADAVILSTQKGSDLGEGVGVLALADGFEYEGLADMRGSISHEGVARTAYAMNPNGLKSPALLPEERAQANGDLVKKFLYLISEMNKELDDAIRVLTSVSQDSKRGHVLEIEVQGVSRKRLSKLTRSYGVYLADDYVSASSETSVRVAFHPYMNHDALKRLAFAFLEALDPYDVEYEDA